MAGYTQADSSSFKFVGYVVMQIMYHNSLRLAKQLQQRSG